MTHNICFILLAVDKENNNDPLKIWGLYLFVLAFPGECVNQLGSEVKSIPERSAGWFKTLDVWHRLMLCDIKKKNFFIDMKFGINQAISQTITQLSCIQLETPSSRLWNFWWIKTYTTFNTLRLRQNGHNFAEEVFKCIFWNENVWISLKISLKFVPRGQINNFPALVPIMAWHRPGDKPLSEPMMVNLLTHICISQPQWGSVIRSQNFTCLEPLVPLNQ